MLVKTALIASLIGVSACAPSQPESWNSYYYGTSRGSMSGYGSPADNDSNYNMPLGETYGDQIYTPQGQRW